MPMPRLPVVTGSELVKALERAGFVVVRQRGSHVQVRRVEPSGVVTTFPVPVHSGRAIKRGTLMGILRKAGIEPDDLRKLI
jgi:predicted RNA binding protein YcfA (HicA-like mRNA interferase family)